MKIQSVSYNNYTNSNMNLKRNTHIQTSFQGLNSYLKPKEYLSYINDESLKYLCSNVASKLGAKEDDITALIKKASRAKLTLLPDITNIYTKAPGDKKPDQQEVISLFKSINKHPDRSYTDILSGFNGSFNQLREILDLAKSKKERSFVSKLQHKILPSYKETPNIIIKLLQSPNKHEYVKHTDKYVSYLKLNKENPDVVKNLDNLVSAKDFDENFYDAKYAVKNFAKEKYVGDYIKNNEEDFISAYTPERESFLKTFFKSFLVNKNYKSQVKGEDIFEMYKTVTPKNLDLRLDILDKFKFKNYLDSTSGNGYEEISNLKSLFNAIDSNKDTYKFVKKIIKDDLNLSLEEMLKIINTIPSKKANIFYNNLKRIIFTTNQKERDYALKNQLENPFYQSETYKSTRLPAIEYGYAKAEGKLSKLNRYVKNKINILRYKMTTEKEVLPANNKPETPAIVQTSKETPVIMDSNTAVTDETAKINMPHKNISTPISKKTPVEKINLQRSFKTAAQARKLLVINDVNGIIQKKLGQKTLERQQETYSKNATKIRLKLLPEIFESIKETRKVNRNSVDNRDAVRLYTRIKGNNRKLIRYMLLKENSDGTRMFSLRDIINYIDKANAKIEQDKKANKLYRAADAKAYYDELHAGMVEQYGKLKIRRNKKPAAAKV